MKTVAVMLCTYNGEKFIGEQLRTLAEQTINDLVVYVSDDGSTDRTLQVISEYKDRFPHLNIELLDGSLRDSRKGFQYNFLSIFNLPALPAKYITFADQDDLWDKDKLAIAIKYLNAVPQGQPGLYGCRTRLIDENNKQMGLSALFKRKPSFANALVQCFAGGNTMMMNAAAWQLIKNTLELGPDICSHDWWCYLVVNGTGGKVIYDDIPRLSYRQHLQNLSGQNITFKARWTRFKKLMQGELGRIIAIHINALEPIKNKLTNDNQHTLENLKKVRDRSLFRRCYYFFASGVYRQKRYEDFALFLAIVWRKI